MGTAGAGCVVSSCCCDWELIFVGGLKKKHHPALTEACHTPSLSILRCKFALLVSARLLLEEAYVICCVLTSSQRQERFSEPEFFVGRNCAEPNGREAGREGWPRSRSRRMAGGRLRLEGVEKKGPSGYSSGTRLDW